MSDDGIERPAVVIDNGTGFLKVGLAGDSRPQAIVPNVVGRSNKKKRLIKLKNDDDDSDEEDLYIGDKALERSAKLTMSYPMSEGVVKNWDDMQQLWEYAYEEIDEDPQDQPVLLTEAPFNPKKNREKTAEIMFEGLEVPGLQLKVQAVLSLFSHGRVTGLVLDSGDGVTHTVPVFHGHILSHAALRSNIAGRDITNLLQRMLFEKGYNFSSSGELKFVREIKEQGCYVAEDFEEEMEKCEKEPDEMEFEYELPDGQTITLTNERFRCTESLFQPHLIAEECPGLHEMVKASIDKCGVDIRRDMLANIMLSGGNTMFKGLATRLHNEITLRTPGAVVVKVLEFPDRAETVFSGASVLASTESFQEEWVTKEMYEEEGVSVIERKCVT